MSNSVSFYGYKQSIFSLSFIILNLFQKNNRTCNSSQNRQLKGLKCICAPGYYESNKICTNCPYREYTSLSQYYQQCNNNQIIRHTITCNLCDSGYHIVSGECQPICGDLQYKYKDMNNVKIVIQILMIYALIVNSNVQVIV
ncbi:unnamed protein product [Paramecium sonneborni]|uniref:Transmembrane protein n=1 Tax=Paramecium sonneborni TaxID=65129 RepID=A0A8S1L863_9CILI|nr:unnamed protein product [Paramecium sonneborni]